MEEQLRMPAPGPHPTAQELYQARRSPEQPASRRILDHALLCAGCSEEMLHQEAFDAPQPISSAELEGHWRRFRASGPPTMRPKPRRWTPYLALAATVAAAALGLALLLRQPSIGEPPAGEDVVRGSELPSSAWSPTGTLAQPPREFRFPGAGGPGRQVMLFDAARTFTWTSEATAGESVELPPEVIAKLEPGREYYWLVLGGREEAARRFVVGR